MRRRTAVALVVAGIVAAVTVGAFVRRWIWYGAKTAEPPDDEAIFTVFAPGGKGSFFVNGPVGRITAKLMPIVEREVYDAAAEMLRLQTDDDLLDIGSGPGAFLATKGANVRSVTGLDVSPVMLRESRRRLADRIAAGTARILEGSAADLPFGDGEFSAVSAIFAPARPRDAFRVLGPGGRFVMADPDPRRSDREPASGWGVPRYGEADYRRMLEEAGFTDVSSRFVGGAVLVSGQKAPVLRIESSETDTRELVGAGA